MYNFEFRFLEFIQSSVIIHILKMLECSVRLLRYDEIPTTDTESAKSENTDVSKKSLNVRKSSRVTQKYSLQNNLVIENDEQLDNKKYRKRTNKKQKFTEVKLENPISCQEKESERKKNQISAFVKSVETNSNYNNTSELPDSSLNLFVNNKSSISAPNSLKINETDTALKDIDMDNVNKDDATDKLKISTNTASDKFLIKPTSKYISSRKKSSLVHNINKNDTSNELGSSDKSITSKVLKNTSRSVTSKKQKLAINNFNESDIPDKIENTINFVVSQAYLSEASKSTENISELKNMNLNEDNKSNVLQKGNATISQKSARTKISPKSIATVKKKPVTNTKNVSCTLEKNNDLIIPRKRGRPQKKTALSPEMNVNISENECYLDRSSKLTKVLEQIKYGLKTNLSQESKDTIMPRNNNKLNKFRKLYAVHENTQNYPKKDLSEKFEDNVMIRDNNKSPKIKNKLCDEWSGDKLLSHSMLKYNNVCTDDLKPKVNNCDKTFKNVLKIKKIPKHKIVKAKRKKILNTNIENPNLIENSNTDIYKYKLITNIPEVHSHENTLSIKNIPSKKTIDIGNDIISETVGVKTINSIPCVAETKSSSDVTETPTVSTEMPQSILSNDNDQQSYLSLDETSEPRFLLNPMINSEINYGMAILSEAISRQCRESTDNVIKRNSPEPDLNEMQCPLKKTSNSPKVPSVMESPQIVPKNMSKEVVKYSSGLCEQSVETNLQSRVDREIFLLSKRFNISIDSLKKTVVDEPLSVFHKKYSESVPSSMVTISPIVKDIETKSKFNVNFNDGNLDIEYKVEPIREGAAYEKSNLKDLMTELSKTMPSWSLSIVTNPPRYVISHMIIDAYGVPAANKCIVLDKSFRASVYINQCLEHTYCKRYTTATEIVNLIKELNSI